MYLLAERVITIALPPQALRLLSTIGCLVRFSDWAVTRSTDLPVTDLTYAEMISTYQSQFSHGTIIKTRRLRSTPAYGVVFLFKTVTRGMLHY